MAPAGPFDAEKLDLGVRILAARGLEASSGPGLHERWRYLAGDDERRASELGAALTRPGVRAVWAARGGYGAMRLLDRIDWAAAAGAEPRWLVGFSDITALHLAGLAAGLGGMVHGPNVTTLGEIGGSDRDHVLDLLMGMAPPPALGVERLRVVAPGTAEGPLWGGNLSLVTRLLGTAHMPDLAGGVLFLEDVGERPYRLDRMLTHLRLAGVLETVAGVVLGDFSDCEEAEAGFTSHDVLAGLLGDLGIPVLTGYPAGHGIRCRALPLGVRARIESGPEGGRLELLEAPWA